MKKPGQQLPSYRVTGVLDWREIHACNTVGECPAPLRAGLLGLRVVSPHPQGLHAPGLAPQPLRSRSARSAGAVRQRRYFLLPSKSETLPQVCLVEHSM